MNLLVSDYDGTLKPLIYPLKNLRANCEAINKFRQSGNKVMISTARSYCSIKREIEKFDIPYDYLSCFDGGLLLDRNDRLIKSFPIDYEVSISLMNTLKQHCIGTHFSIGQNKYNEIMELIVFSSIKEYLEDTKKLDYFKETFPHLEYLKAPLITFIRTTGGKTRTIDYLANEHSFDRIVTIGDNLNDLSMLREYEGYKILMNCTPLMLEKFPSTTSVKSLIKKISK